MEKSYVLRPHRRCSEDFYLCSCGYAQRQPHRCFEPAMRPDYLLYFILDGKGVYRCGKRRFALRTGDGFLVEPDTAALCESDANDPWSYLWIGFGGARSADYLKRLGLGSQQLTFYSPDGETLAHLISSMLLHCPESIENDFALQGLLFQFFASLARSISLLTSAACKEQDKESREDLYVRRAVEYVQYNYSKHITVTDIAKYTAVNRSYLFTVFQRVLGISPQEFLTAYRLARAKGLLLLTNTSIAEIAAAVGYRDPLVFSKAFKQATGITPVQYRQIERDREAQGLSVFPPLLSRSGRPLCLPDDRSDKPL